MTSRLRGLGLTVASLALLGSAVAVACAAEVKGPVHITSRGVEPVAYYDHGHGHRDRDPDRAADRAAREAGRMQRDADRVRAREIAHAVRDAARDVAQQQAEIARAVVQAAHAVSVDQARIARDVSRAARDAAREVSRESRDIARAARKALDSAMELQTVVMDQNSGVAADIEQAITLTLDIQQAVGDPLRSARSSLDSAEKGLDHQAEQLDAIREGDYSNVVVEADGVTKCSDPARHPGCAPLSDGDKADILAAMESGLSQARDGLARARSGLARAEETAGNSSTP